MKEKVGILVVGLFVLFSLNFVSSVQTSSSTAQVTTNVNLNQGLNIIYPQFDFAVYNAGFEVIIHVHNISNNNIVTDANCTAIVYNHTGQEVLKANFSSYNSSKFGYNLSVPAGSLAQQEHAFYIYCISASGEGWEEGLFGVNIIGQEFEVPKAISYLGFIIILLFTFVMTLYGASKVKWGHIRANDEKLISVNNFRYFKVFLFTLAYFELMFLFGLSYKLFNEANIEGFTQFFNFIYNLFLNLLYPLMISLIIIVFVIWITNRKLVKNLKLGINK